MNKKKILTIVIAVLVVAAIGVGWWYYQKSHRAQRAIERAGDFMRNLGEKAVQGVLPSIDPKSNPMENAPDINPVSKTNPFSNIKTNPF